MMTLGTAGVIRAHVTIPLRGPAVAEVIADGDSDITGGVTLADDSGISLAMTVARGGVNPALLQWEGVLVGGAGGLGTLVKGAYQQAQLGDVLQAVAGQAGETLSADIAAAVLQVPLASWTLTSLRAAAALDLLAAAATQSLGQAVNWRILGDGTLWMGVESWDAATLPADAEIVDPSPLSPFQTIGCAVASLLPGVDLDGVGRITTAEHFVDAERVRTWAWTSPTA